MKAGEFFATDLIISIKKVTLYPNAIGYEIRFDYNDSGNSKNPRRSTFYEPTIVMLYENDIQELGERLAELGKE